MTVTKGKKFRKGNLLVQYWYKNGRSHTKKLMIIGIGSKILSHALVYAYTKAYPSTTFMERAFRDY